MAIKGQNLILSVATAAGSAKTITGLTAASPGVVTSTSHGLANGTVGVITSVAGMIEVNDRAFVTASAATNTFELKGVDTSTYTAYTSGGSFTPQTMTAIGAVRSFGGFNGQANEIDTTHLRSTAKEYMLGLQDFGTAEFGFFMISDTGQSRLRTLKASGASSAFTVSLSDGRIAAFMAYVQSFTVDQITPDTAVGGSCTLRITGEPAWFA